MVTIAGYEVLSTLYEGSRSLVYRGRSDQQPIILKVMQASIPASKNWDAIGWNMTLLIVSMGMVWLKPTI